MSKSHLRQQLRQQRRKIQGIDRHRRIAVIERRLATLPALKSARRIGCYFAFDGEPDLTRFMLGHVHRIWLPVINRRLQLAFRPAPIGLNRHKLRMNGFGILEPQARPTIRASNLDVILMPLVGFDDQGNRLGMGAGFYDRSLQGLRRPRPRLVGIAFDTQRVGQLPADPWDVPLDHVVTERRIYTATGAKE